jgi:hypothetical protein
MTATITAVGLTTRLGTLPLILDGDAGTGWAPQPTRLSSFIQPFTDVYGNPNVGAEFAFLQFDFGIATRVPLMLIQLQTEYTLGDCMMIASDNPATTTLQAVQTGDVLLGLFPRYKMALGQILETLAKNSDISRRYIRMCFHGTGTEMTPSGTPDETGGTATNQQYFDTGSGTFIIPDCTELVIEGWGGGASGGESATANNGGATTVSTYSLTANGGSKSATTTPNTVGTPAAGGTASGGNHTNTTGGAGGLISGTNGDPSASGKGGDAPNGGLGGAAAVAPPFVLSPYANYKSGFDGASPGGGGSGRNFFNPSPAFSYYFKYPGGASGGYFKHVLVIPDDADVGDSISYSIGAGGSTTQMNGVGAPGRVKFSWTPTV